MIVVMMIFHSIETLESIMQYTVFNVGYAMWVLLKQASHKKIRRRRSGKGCRLVGLVKKIRRVTKKPTYRLTTIAISRFTNHNYVLFKKTPRN